MSLSFKKVTKKLLNSNGTYLESFRGFYRLNSMIMAKEGKKISSFNGISNTFKTLPKSIIDYGNLREILDQTSKLLGSESLSGKFIGDIILTPQCLDSIVSMFARISLKDTAVYTNSSKFTNKLNKKVVSEKLTLHSSPVSDEISSGYFITTEGYVAKNVTLFEKGVLKSFLLSDYGARKAKKERSANTGNVYVIDPGESELQSMIKNVKQGLFISRISSGAPAVNGDFSGIAKNSFYIENGEINKAVNETMISCNVYNLMNSIKEISKSRVNLGDAILPWISFEGVTISSK